MKRSTRLMQLLAGAMIVTAPGMSARAQSTECGAANDTSAALITDLKAWMKTEDPDRVVLRDRVFHIPFVAESQISVVTDPRTCGEIVKAYSRLSEFAYTPSRVYVIRIGTEYAGYDPDRKGGEFVAVHLFDSKYTHIGGWSF